MTEYKIQNMTVAYTLKNDIKLPPDLPNVKYDAQKFNGAIWKHNGLTFLIFRTGKINCVGGKKIENVQREMNNLAKTLENYIVEEKLVNLVASQTLAYNLDLTSLHDYLKARYNVSYEPELFAGLKVTLSGVVVICFHTGKVIMTGAKHESDFENVIKRMKPFLIMCKKSK